MRSVVLGVLAAVFLSAATAASAAGPATAEAERREILALTGKLDRLTLQAVDARLQVLMAAKGFEELLPRERCALQTMAGAGKLELRQNRAAADLLAKAAACPEADKLTWNLRLDAAMRIGDYDAATASLLQLAQHAPAEIDEFLDASLLRVMARSRTLDNGRQRQFELLDAMNDIGWKPSDPAFVADGLWASLALDLAEEGRLTRASAVAQRIVHPWTLAYMRGDRRFDALFDHGAARFDPEAASVVELELRRKLVADHPEKVANVVDYANDLYLHHHPETALELIDAAVARIKAAPKDKPPYEDLAEKGTWLKDYRSQVLFELGRDDEALQILVEAASEKEDGGDNVSQVINLAGVYSELGRPREALATLQRLTGGSSSPFGLMQAEKVRAEACAQLADKACLDKAMAYLRGHEKDAPSALVEALVVAGDLDAVTAILIRRLADPEDRYATLADLQDFAAHLKPNPMTRLEHERWRALVGRPDLKAAIDKVGRINRYSFMDAG